MTETPQDSSGDLIDGDKSLLDLFRLYLRIPAGMTYYLVVLAVFLLALVFTLWAWPAPSQLGTLIRDTSETIFQFAAEILGIVIAGFAIFSTVATTDIVGPFAYIKRDNPPVPELKYLALHFVGAFVPYLLFLVFHALVLAFGWPGGPIAKAARYTDPVLVRCLGAMVFAFICAFLAHLLFVLQALVYNVYKAFMTMAQVKADLLAEEHGDPDPVHHAHNERKPPGTIPPGA